MQVTPQEYEEPPEIDDAFIERARKRGPLRTKQAVSLRLDVDLAGRLRATGAGWQSRANAALHAWAEKNGV